MDYTTLEKANNLHNKIKKCSKILTALNHGYVTFHTKMGNSYPGYESVDMYNTVDKDLADKIYETVESYIKELTKQFTDM